MIEIVNWYLNRKHYADPTSLQGGEYLSLCGRASGRTLADSAAYWQRRGYPAKDHAKTPLCKLCAKKSQTEVQP